LSSSKLYESLLLVTTTVVKIMNWTKKLIFPLPLYVLDIKSSDLAVLNDSAWFWFWTKWPMLRLSCINILFIFCIEMNMFMEYKKQEANMHKTQMIFR